MRNTRILKAAAITILAMGMAAPGASIAAGTPGTGAAASAGAAKAVTPAVAAQVTSLLARFPAANAADRDAACGELVKLGPGAVEDLCGRLTAPGAGDDSAVRFALNGLAVYVTRKGADKEREMFARGLVKALPSVGDKDAQAFVISQLQLTGGAESVKALAACLRDERLADPAARALVALHLPEGVKALLKSLPAASVAGKLAIIQALGGTRSPEAVKRLLPFADGSDDALRHAALDSLAEIGDPAAGPVLARSRIAASPYERSEAAVRYLRFAYRLSASGRSDAGLAIARELVKYYAAPAESHIASGGLALIVSVLKEKALPDLLAAADSPDAKFRASALELAQTIPGPEATAPWVEKLRTAPAATKAEVIAMLGRRGDPSALPAVRMALRDADASVRLAAIPAAAALSGAALVPDLLAFFSGKDDAEIAAARTALLGFAREVVVPAAVEHMGTASVAGRAALIDLLADKGATDRVDLAFSQALSPDAPVRAAACRALARLASERDVPSLVDLLFAASDPDDVVNLQNAIAAAAEKNPARENRADAVLGMMAGAEAPRKAVLLRLLPRIGGAKALAAVVVETRSKDAATQSVAVYALSQWPDFSAGNDLLRIIANPGNKKNLLLALSGYVRLVKESSFPNWKRIGLLMNVMGMVKDDADKKAALAGAAEMRGPEAFRFLGGFVRNAALGPTAIQGLLDMASEQAPEERWLSGHEAYSILSAAEEAASDTADKERAGKIIADRLRQGGFVPLFDGRDLEGWKGLVADPPKRARMTADELAKAQAAADEVMRAHWRIENGVLVFDGKGESLCTMKDYGDFEMLVDWKIEKAGDSGIYLRGSPQVQIWDPVANPVGSGGLYNNQKGPSKPLTPADRPVGEWNTFRIIMIGERVTVYLNDKMVVDNTVLENYWERDKPIYPVGQLELQAHGNVLYFKNIFVREIPRDPAPAGGGVPYALSDSEKEEGFAPLFNGTDLAGWTGDTKGYVAENGKIVIYPERGSGNLYTEKEFDDFVFRFEFKLTPAANNGIGIRAPLEGDAAYVGMEIQVLEDGSPVYWTLQPYQYHGSIYGVVPARRGELRPVGEWNTEEITARGRRVRVVVNGVLIVDADLDQASAGGTIDHNPHPGLARKSGHIGFLGHGSLLEFRNIRIRELR